MFEQSGVMEDILPRQVNDSEGLRTAYPWLFNQSTSNNELTGDEAFNQADVKAIDQVSKKIHSSSEFIDYTGSENTSV